ncbi:hypothetical protein EWM64_g4105 [Hericium alpestre]|uniref:F-box domain-containing protein n=1 Tax=Hericium alpestre TaxID=135208 RepID=A0A4Z0A0E3_9AGAM|nr:hypothetical protein EWM64_g4105 [Hericium alpestre]
MLHALELSVVSPRRLDIPLPKRIFNDNAPMLHRLHLKGVHVSLSSPALFGLTHLHIEEHGDPDHESSRDSGVPQALRQLPALESLYLANTLPIGMSYLDSSPIRLPRLQKLTLIDEGPACTDVLGWLEIPASCKIHLECEFYDESELEECLPMLCGCIPANADPFHTLSVVGVDVDEARAGLKLWRDSNIHDLHLPVDPDLFISTFCPAESHQPANILKVMCNTLPLSDVCTIHAQHWEGVLSRDLWKRLFAKNCPKTSNISMSKWSEVVSLCSALTTKLDDKLPARGEEEHGAVLPLDQLFLPDLKHISLESVNVRFRTEWNDKGSVLVSALNMRRSAGRAVSVVRLGKGCVFNAAQLRELRDVVHVELDPDVIVMPEASVAGPG